MKPTLFVDDLKHTHRFDEGNPLAEKNTLRDTGRVLLDAEMNVPVVAEIREVIAASPLKAQLGDLHVWRVGKGKFACILSLATDSNVSPEYFKKQLRIHEELVHISVEINKLDGYA